MKTNQRWRPPRQRIPTSFEPEEVFEVDPAFTAPKRGASELALDRLKDRLLMPVLAEADPALAESLQWAAREAASLAWTTSVPLLVLPELLSEKVNQARRQSCHQQRIWKRLGNPLKRVV